MALPLLTLALCASASVWAAVVPEAHTHRPISFDYVIVGGGTAGLTLANRLSEHASVTVAVIEAGTYVEKVAGNLSAVPAYAGSIENLSNDDTSVGWGFKTTPQPLGGCSSINDVAYSRSTIGAFQLWADTVGDQSYTWDNVLPYYKKSMDFTPPNRATRFANATPSYDAASTVRGGPLDVTYPAYGESWSTWVSRGLTAIGLPQIGALIDGTLYGSTFQLLTVNPITGHRASSDTAFLRPVLGRANLVVFTETLAERVLFNSKKQATGVAVTSANGTAFTITAKKEVILSAGVVQSPQLLMVSGIGPAAVLKQYKIPVLADLPGVGQGLLDHILIPLTWHVNLATPDVTSAAAVRGFNNNRPASGPLTNPGGDFAGLEKIPTAFRSNWSAATDAALGALPSDWPEVEYLVRPFAVSNGTVAGEAYASLFIVLQTPQSVGNVTIASASMHDAPLINPNWLTAQADLDVMLAALRRIREMAASPAMADVIIGDEFLPGPQYQSDEEILEYFRLAGTSIHHGHATNRMGKAGDVNAVVGTTGKVYGVQNYMLAEKLADAIKHGK
ncbi:Versicolorin B synthase [Cytospora mali]|uniref:Versicolorin B synthase n=1 Tax=Cytospora mali TaxID=578113 RepID=A0A194VZV4_CYTMA|nr:Versicolorin B synthase [Valsa mali]